MGSEFKESGSDFGSLINVDAVLHMARQRVVTTGRADTEFNDLNAIEERFRDGKMTAEEVQREVDEMLGARQDYN